VENLNIVSEVSSRLSEVLDDEFSALEAKSFNYVEDLQNPKFELMQELQVAWEAMRADKDSSSPLIDELTQKLEICKEKHLRNSILLNKQMEITRNLLNAITQKTSANASVYDKLGKLA
jgi:flagellar biosynthesis/type III secretory pathway chaperone